jgi:hypothetical protein
MAVDIIRSVTRRNGVRRTRNGERRTRNAERRTRVEKEEEIKKCILQYK